jgi:hypothetical protein
MSCDVRAKNMTATGDSGLGRTRIRGISWSSAAGSISLKDGSSSGTELIKIDTAAASTTYIQIPGDGVLFQGSPYLTLTTITSVTLFYG